MDLRAARSPIEHALVALRERVGLEGEASRLTETQKRLLQKIASDPGGVKANAEASLAFWRREKERLRGVTEAYRAGLPAERRATIGQLDPYLLEEMVLASGSTDTDFVSDLAAGFPITGHLPSGARAHQLRAVNGCMGSQDLEVRLTSVSCKLGASS